MNFYQQKYYRPYHQIATEYQPQDQLPHYRQYLKQKNSNNIDSSASKQITKSPSPNKRNRKISLRQSKPRQQIPQWEQKKSSPVRFERKMNRVQSNLNKSPLKAAQKHLNSSEQPVWEYLYKEGVKLRKQKQLKHELSKNKIDMECTFQPIIKPSKRYPGYKQKDFMERINAWQDNKIEKIFKEKQEEINKDLRQCTFSPIINQSSKRKVNEDFYVRNGLKRQKSATVLKSNNKDLIQQKQHYSPIKQKSQKRIRIISPYQANNTKEIDTQNAKKMIRNELQRLLFR